MRTETLLLLCLALGCPSSSSDDDDSATTPADPEPCSSWAPAAVLANVQDDDLSEISGIVASRQNPDVLWVHQDSGDGAVITALDRDGETRGTITLDGVNANDHEDIALGACGDGEGWCLVLGDIGDNAMQRAEVVLRRVPEPDLSGESTPFDLTLQPEELAFTYPDGPADCEALVLLPDGSPVLMTKRDDGTSNVHRLPPDGWEQLGVAEADLVGTLTTGPTGGLLDSVTGADLTRTGDHLLVRTYGALRSLDVRELGPGTWEDAPARVMLPGAELQGEAVAWDVDERAVLHVGEAEEPPIYRLACRSEP